MEDVYRAPTHPHFKRKDSLWMDGCHSLSWAGDELTSREYALSFGELFQWIDTSPALPLPAAIQDEGASFVALLRVCTKNKDLYRGIQIHNDILRRGLLDKCSDALVALYAKCGALEKAKALLDMHKSRDVFTWNALIAGYAREGQGQNALDCFDRMQREGILPSAVTYSSILKACGSIGEVDKGKEIHDAILRQGLLQSNIILGNALVDMYAKCGALSKARDVLEKLPFRDVVSWSTLIAGYAQEGQGEEALNCFELMKQEGILPDAVTYICVLRACATIGAADEGKKIHDEVAKQGLLQNNILLGTAVMDMYAKCGALSKAQDVLEKLPSRDVVSWSALIAGYAQEGQGEQALNCFERMQREGIPPNAVTYICILKACATVGAVDKGKQIHDEVAKQGLLQTNIALGNALVDMYVKCGALSKAQDVLENLSSRDVVSWSALIAGYAQEGQGEQAIKCFKRMQAEGISPNSVTFSCVLNVCSHLGLVEEGHTLFESMSKKYGVNPSLECYTCMVDLYGRAGHLEKAVQLTQEMPSANFCTIWLALLSACRKWGNVNVGRWAFEQAVKVDKSDGPAYILMENIYATAGMQENAENIETMRIRNKAWKKPGHNPWIASSKGIHTISVGDTMNAQSRYSYADITHKISRPLRLTLGVSPNTFDAANVHLLCHHSEKPALACAFNINCPVGC